MSGIHCPRCGDVGDRQGDEDNVATEEIWWFMHCYDCAWNWDLHFTNPVVENSESN